MKKFLYTIIILLLIQCSASDKLLVGHDFSKGDWFLVNVNYSDNTLQVIDDETVLQNNKHGLWVTSAANCEFTTCDGFLKLYRDGKLVIEDQYLSRSYIFESSAILKHYQLGKEWTAHPSTSDEFIEYWDSLKNSGSYPTIYHTQPDDKDIIWVYKIEEN